MNILTDIDYMDHSHQLVVEASQHPVSIDKVLHLLNISFESQEDDIQTPPGFSVASDDEFHSAELFALPVDHPPEETPEASPPKSHSGIWLEARYFDSSRSRGIVFPNDARPELRLMLFRPARNLQGQEILQIISTEIRNMKGRRVAQGKHIVRRSCDWDRRAKRCIGECPSGRHCHGKVISSGPSGVCSDCKCT
ncbi:hypothetical protein ACIRS1_29090 [Kitasatospora sp. NPDC101176]|uniref:hypothetical protein n=1 Tax=Kitasatospora sp. NPDC101176 TaxID=3364099 RepID=UPI0038122C32